MKKRGNSISKLEPAAFVVEFVEGGEDCAAAAGNDYLPLLFRHRVIYFTKSHIARFSADAALLNLSQQK